jgi:hypothetical protein
MLNRVLLGLCAFTLIATAYLSLSVLLLQASFTDWRNLPWPTPQFQADDV